MTKPRTIKLRSLKPKTPPPPPVRDTPVHRFVQLLRDKDGVAYRTTDEVATEVGVSTQWVRKIQRQGLLGVPSMVTQFGKITVYLYTPQDIEKIRRYLVERQAVYANVGPTDQIQTWEEVKHRRERASTQSEDRPVGRDDGSQDNRADPAGAG
jgi:hypothetical protein